MGERVQLIVVAAISIERDSLIFPYRFVGGIHAVATPDTNGLAVKKYERVSGISVSYFFLITRAPAQRTHNLSLTV